MMLSPAQMREVPVSALAIADRFRSHGYRAWIVGGCVRDLLLGRVPSDWDLCTDATPPQMLALFPRAIPTGLAHGTITVVDKRVHYEVTTLRGEGTYSDGRRPDSVHFVRELSDDLARRDFTVNAMAIDPVLGRLEDPHAGAADLQARVLRAVGDPVQRFSEDGLRVLRAARFAAQLEFSLDPSTKRAISATLDTFRKVSAERVRDEWRKSMKARRPSVAFDLMRETGILGIVCPELLEGVGCEQNRYHSYDVWGHAMACMDACPGADDILRIAALMHDVGKPRSRAHSDKTNDYTFYDHERIGAEMVAPICQRLRFSTEETSRISHLVRQHMWHYDGWSDAAVRRWIQRVGLTSVEDLFALRSADLLGKGTPVLEEERGNMQALREHIARVMAAGAALSIRDLQLDGHGLMRELQLAPGPILGELLKALLELVIGDPQLNTREILLQRAREMVAESTK
jgi:tRNA nucleotidyltransferase (CCA-adding enzyme)